MALPEVPESAEGDEQEDELEFISHTPSTGLGPISTGCPVRWYEPPHPLALSGEHCDALLDSIDGHDGFVGGPHETKALSFITETARLANEANWRRTCTPRGYMASRTDKFDDSPWHHDNQPEFDQYGNEYTPDWRLSVVALVSDPNDYDGGALAFHTDRSSLDLTNPLRMPRTRGTIGVFIPTTLHTVEPVTDGCRRSIVSFWGPPEPEADEKGDERHPGLQKLVPVLLNRLEAATGVPAAEHLRQAAESLRE